MPETLLSAEEAELIQKFIVLDREPIIQSLFDQYPPLQIFVDAFVRVSRAYIHFTKRDEEKKQQQQSNDFVMDNNDNDNNDNNTSFNDDLINEDQLTDDDKQKLYEIRQKEAEMIEMEKKKKELETRVKEAEKKLAVARQKKTELEEEAARVLTMVDDNDQSEEVNEIKQMINNKNNNDANNNKEKGVINNNSVSPSASSSSSSSSAVPSQSSPFGTSDHAVLGALLTLSSDSSGESVEGYLKKSPEEQEKLEKLFYSLSYSLHQHQLLNENQLLFLHLLFTKKFPLLLSALYAFSINGNVENLMKKIIEIAALVELTAAAKEEKENKNKGNNDNNNKGATEGKTSLPQVDEEGEDGAEEADDVSDDEENDMAPQLSNKNNNNNNKTDDKLSSVSASPQSINKDATASSSSSSASSSSKASSYQNQADRYLLRKYYMDFLSTFANARLLSVDDAKILMGSIIDAMKLEMPYVQREKNRIINNEGKSDSEIEKERFDDEKQKEIDAQTNPALMMLSKIEAAFTAFTITNDDNDLIQTLKIIAKMGNDEKLMIPSTTTMTTTTAASSGNNNNNVISSASKSPSAAIDTKTSPAAASKNNKRTQQAAEEENDDDYEEDFEYFDEGQEEEDYRSGKKTTVGAAGKQQKKANTAESLLPSSSSSSGAGAVSERETDIDMLYNHIQSLLPPDLFSSPSQYNTLRSLLLALDPVLLRSYHSYLEWMTDMNRLKKRKAEKEEKVKEGVLKENEIYISNEDVIALQSFINIVAKRVQQAELEQNAKGGEKIINNNNNSSTTTITSPVSDSSAPVSAASILSQTEKHLMDFALRMITHFHSIQLINEKEYEKLNGLIMRKDRKIMNAFATAVDDENMDGLINDISDIIGRPIDGNEDAEEPAPVSVDDKRTASTPSAVKASPASIIKSPASSLPPVNASPSTRIASSSNPPSKPSTPSTRTAPNTNTNATPAKSPSPSPSSNHLHPIHHSSASSSSVTSLSPGAPALRSVASPNTKLSPRTPQQPTSTSSSSSSSKSSKSLSNTAVKPVTPSNNNNNKSSVTPSQSQGSARAAFASSVSGSIASPSGQLHLPRTLYQSVLSSLVTEGIIDNEGENRLLSLYDSKDAFVMGACELYAATGEIDQLKETLSLLADDVPNHLNNGGVGEEEEEENDNDNDNNEEGEEEDGGEGEEEEDIDGVMNNHRFNHRSAFGEGNNGDNDNDDDNDNDGDYSSGLSGVDMMSLLSEALGGGLSSSGSGLNGNFESEILSGLSAIQRHYQQRGAENASTAGGNSANSNNRGEGPEVSLYDDIEEKNADDDEESDGVADNGSGAAVL